MLNDKNGRAYAGSTTLPLLVFDARAVPMNLRAEVRLNALHRDIDSEYMVLAAKSYTAVCMSPL